MIISYYVCVYKYFEIYYSIFEFKSFTEYIYLNKIEKIHQNKVNIELDS